MNELKLNNLNLSRKEMEHVKGGWRMCGCACFYADQGGSSIADNRDANYAGGEHGLKSPHTLKEAKFTP